MFKYQANKKLLIPAIMMIVSFGLITGCDNKDSNKIKRDSDSTSVYQQQRVNEGQANDSGQGQTYTATLKASNEVGDVSSNASGDVTVTMRGNSIHIKGEFSGLSTDYTASHIHMGAKGNNGGVIQPLDPTIGNDKISGSWDNSYKLNNEQMSALKAGNLYINVHSTKYKSGEIRGQLRSGR